MAFPFLYLSRARRRHPGKPALLPGSQALIASVVNVPESSIARESDVVLPNAGGTGDGVASTKAFTCQLSVLACMAIAAGRQRGALSAAEEAELVHALVQAPRLVTEVLRREDEFNALAHSLAKAPLVLYLGRGSTFPVALEALSN